VVVQAHELGGDGCGGDGSAAALPVSWRRRAMEWRGSGVGLAFTVSARVTWSHLAKHACHTVAVPCARSPTRLTADV
jgi:hypothetical protein